MDKLILEAKNLITAAKSGTIDEAGVARLATIQAEIKSAQALAASIADGEALLAGVKSVGAPAAPVADADDAPARSLGEHFVKNADFASFKANRALGMQAPEFKASAPTTVGTAQVNDVGNTIVAQTRQAPTVAALFSSGTISGNGLSYRVEKPVAGTVTAVAEGKPKARVTYTYDEVREGISKVGAFTEITDEMVDDLSYVASEINGNLVTDLDIELDRQILDGDGTGANVKGVLRRTGVLTVASASVGDNLDAVHRATTLTSIASSREADAVVLHPVDFEAFKLQKDKNGNYLSGAPLASGFVGATTIWGRNAIVTTAMTQGKVLVGAFATGSVLRKGGVKVKSTDAHGENFIEGVTTIVAEARLGLKVPKPAAFAIVTLSATPAE